MSADTIGQGDHCKDKAGNVYQVMNQCQGFGQPVAWQVRRLSDEQVREISDEMLQRLCVKTKPPRVRRGSRK